MRFRVPKIYSLGDVGEWPTRRQVRGLSQAEGEVEGKVGQRQVQIIIKVTRKDSYNQRERKRER